MAHAVPNPPNDRRRVKVYELRNNDWFDRGTGFCTGQIINDEPKVFVESEDQPERMLLESRITKDDGYQKQQETLIVWTETTGVDMALSFQEAEGCAAIWQFVSHIQQQLIALAGPDDALSDDVDNFPNQVALPIPEIGNLVEIEQLMRGASMSNPGRDALSKLVISDEYIPKLIPLVQKAEELESLHDLHRLCNIMKTLILLNDSAIIEYVVTDEIILGVVGALEYDPDFPSHKANHRQYLSDESKFKEVVRIEDPNIKRKIHHTYRLQYLKDVVLARILDDPTFSVLNSLIFFNQVDIVTHLHANTTFLKELFSIFGASEQDPQRKKNAVHFIQQCCAIAKNLTAPSRSELYTNFIHGGLFGVINFALRHQDASVRIAGTDVLVAMIDHDPAMMRGFILKQISEKQTPLTDTLIELLLVEVDQGVKAQIADAIKVLLDPQSNLQNEGLGKASSDLITKRRIHTNPRTEFFLQNFYDESAKKLFKPLKDLQDRESMRDFSIHEVALFVHLVEILCFFMRQHQYRSKYFILAEHLTSRVAQLLTCSEKHLKLTALKFFRTAIGLQDEFYNRQIMSNHLLEPILGIVLDTMPKDNLLNSACLELFEFIKREKIKPLILYFVEKYHDTICEITYVDIFQRLADCYEDIKAYNPEDARNLLAQEEEQRRNAARTQVNGTSRWQGVKEMEDEQEKYFNTSDDEDEPPRIPTDSPIITLPSNGPLAAASSTTANGVQPLKPLVDYPADDDDDDDEVSNEPALAPAADADAMDVTSTNKPVRARTSSPASTTTPSPPTLPSTPTESNPLISSKPPERKRPRDDEDDEDALGKLSSSKRRASGGHAPGPGIHADGSGGVPDGKSLKRKKSLVPAHAHLGRDAEKGEKGGKKIAISLAVKKEGDVLERRRGGEDGAGKRERERERDGGGGGAAPG